MRCRYSILLGVVSLVGHVGTAAAQAKDPVAAESLFRDARDAAKRGDYASACPKFAESQRLDPAAGTLLNLADCEEHTGKLASAWLHYREAAEQLPASDPRLTMAKDHIGALETRLPKLTIRLADGAPPGTKVLRDHVELGAASLGTPVTLDPGAHVIVARTPSGKEQRTDLVLKEGQNESLTMSISEDATPGVAPRAAPPPAAPPPQTSSSGGSSSTLGYVVGGVGAASLVVSLVTGGLVLGKKSTVQSGCDAQKFCTTDAIDAGSSGKTLSAVSTVTFVVGLAGIGLGTYFILSSKPDGATTALRANASPDGAALALTRTFLCGPRRPLERMHNVDRSAGSRSSLASRSARAAPRS
jgi:hypothetical protein